MRPPVLVYEWRALSASSLDRFTSKFAAFAAHGGTEVVIDVSRVVDSSQASDTAARTQADHEFRSALTAYIERAASAGLTVSAIAGSPHWIAPGTRYLNAIVVSFVASFNAAARPDRRLLGLQFDLEPWTQPSWATDPSTGVRDLLDTIASITDHLRQAQPAGYAPLTITLPFWLDGTAEPRTFRRDGLQMSPTQHVMRLLDTASEPRNSVAIMAYRDRTDTSDGSIALASREFRLAAEYGGRVRVVIAQETTKVDPPKTTFHEEGLGALMTAMTQLTAAYGTQPSFGGFAINDMAALSAWL